MTGTINEDVAVLKSQMEQMVKSMDDLSDDIKSVLNELKGIAQTHNDDIIAIKINQSSQSEKIGEMENKVDDFEEIYNKFSGVLWTVRGAWIGGGGYGVFKLLQVYF